MCHSPRAADSTATTPQPEGSSRAMVVQRRYGGQSPDVGSALRRDNPDRQPDERQADQERVLDGGELQSQPRLHSHAHPVHDNLRQRDDERKRQHDGDHCDWYRARIEPRGQQ